MDGEKGGGQAQWEVQFFNEAELRIGVVGKITPFPNPPQAAWGEGMCLAGLAGRLGVGEALLEEVEGAIDGLARDVALVGDFGDGAALESLLEDVFVEGRKALQEGFDLVDECGSFFRAGFTVCVLDEPIVRYGLFFAGVAFSGCVVSGFLAGLEYGDLDEQLPELGSAIDLKLALG